MSSILHLHRKLCGLFTSGTCTVSCILHLPDREVTEFILGLCLALARCTGDFWGFFVCLHVVPDVYVTAACVDELGSRWFLPSGSEYKSMSFLPLTPFVSRNLHHERTPCVTRGRTFPLDESSRGNHRLREKKLCAL